MNKDTLDIQVGFTICFFLVWFIGKVNSSFAASSFRAGRESESAFSHVSLTRKTVSRSLHVLLLKSVFHTRQRSSHGAWYTLHPGWRHVVEKLDVADPGLINFAPSRGFNEQNMVLRTQSFIFRISALSPVAGVVY